MKPVWLKSALSREECVERVADLVDPRLPRAEWDGRAARRMLRGWQDADGFHVLTRGSPEVEPGVCVRGRWRDVGGSPRVELQPSLTAHGIRVMLMGWTFVPLVAAAVWAALEYAATWQWGSPLAGALTLAAVGALLSLLIFRVLWHREAAQIVEAIADALEAREVPPPPRPGEAPGITIGGKTLHER